MEPLPDIYPLTGLQIGDMQSYISRTFLYFAPLSNKVFILVDNQPWTTSKQSRSARLWQFMVTKAAVDSVKMLKEAAKIRKVTAPEVLSALAKIKKGKLNTMW